MPDVLDERPASILDEQGFGILDEASGATLYPIQNPQHPGAPVLFISAQTGDEMTPGYQTALLAYNAVGTDITVVLPVTAKYDGLAVTYRTVVCLPGLTLIPLPDSVYGSFTTVGLIYSAPGLLVAQIVLC
jgi:hypothetical protein